MAVHYDERWKTIIEKLFPQFLSFFLTQLYSDVDLSQGYSWIRICVRLKLKNYSRLPRIRAFDLEFYR